MEQVKHLQINVNHSQVSNSYAFVIAAEMNIHILCLQDTYLDDHIVMPCPEDCIQFVSNSNNCVTVIYNSNLNYSFKFNSYFMVCIELCYNAVIFSIMNFYFPPRKDIDSLFEYINVIDFKI